MVVFDATMLMLLIRPDSGRPIDPESGEPVGHITERLAYFVEQHEKNRTKIGIPTPALSEVLVRSGASAVKIVEKLKEFAIFEILPFDEISAIEVAIMTRNAIDAGDKKAGSEDIWSKVKYDRQIIAIARARQATAIYTDDKGLRNIARSINLPVKGLSDLQFPPDKAQGVLALNDPAESSDEPTLDEIEEAREVESDQSNPS